MTLATYYRLCDKAQWSTYGSANYDDRIRIRAKLKLLAAEADGDPEKTEIYLAFTVASCSRRPGSPEGDHLPWPAPEDFNLGPADLE